MRPPQSSPLLRIAGDLPDRFVAGRVTITHVLKLCVVSAMLCASGAAARAQDADTRHGGWMGLGLGYGLARLTCDSCRGARQLDGWTFNLGLGGTPNSQVQGGGPGDFWLNGLHQGKLPTISTGTVLLAYYPSVSGSAFVEAGVGFSNYALEHGTGDAIEPVSDDYPSYSSGTGWGYTLGDRLNRIART